MFLNCCEFNGIKTPVFLHCFVKEQKGSCVNNCGGKNNAFKLIFPFCQKSPASLEHFKILGTGSLAY